ncbi:MAG: flagellar assembly protein FliW [Firmicutes bacterium]|nr:flagellar assembly protein FliW [Bacillota bacterium]
MLLQTTRFGEIEVDAEKVISFPHPLPGLPKSNSYVILDIPGNPLFKWMQSCNQPEVALVIADPSSFFSDYRVKITKEELAVLNIEDGDECQVAVVLVVPEDPRKITANLLAPLVFNYNKRRAVQIILNDSAYTTRHIIFPAAQEAV